MFAIIYRSEFSCKFIVMSQKILLVTPPFTQLNTPYPATAYLKGFLNTKNISAYQMDLGMEVILQLFTKEKLQLVFDTAYESDTIISENAKRLKSTMSTMAMDALECANCY